MFIHGSLYRGIGLTCFAVPRVHTPPNTGRDESSYNVSQRAWNAERMERNQIITRRGKLLASLKKGMERRVRESKHGE
jgi:hypothetical protein